MPTSALQGSFFSLELFQRIKLKRDWSSPNFSIKNDLSIRCKKQKTFFIFNSNLDFEMTPRQAHEQQSHQRPLVTRTGFQYIIPPISDVFDKIEYFFCILQVDSSVTLLRNSLFNINKQNKKNFMVIKASKMGGWGYQESFSDYTVLYGVTKVHPFVLAVKQLSAMIFWSRMTMICSWFALEPLMPFSATILFSQVI